MIFCFKELGKVAARHGNLHHGHNATHPRRASRQLRDHQDSAGSRLDTAHASRCSLRVRIQRSSLNKAISKTTRRFRCDLCVQSRQQDSLRHSRSRINAYRALASPSLISLSSKDPILTAFELSWELRRLSFLEHEFKCEYQVRSNYNSNRHSLGLTSGQRSRYPGST